MEKILILGGINLHSKVVNAAKEMGYYTGVVDYLQPKDAPAKLIADEHYEINVFDIDKIVGLCKKENYIGVLNTHIDPCQLPYFEICNSLGFPCYITDRKQLDALTDKKAFKDVLVQNGLDVIKTYNDFEIYNGLMEYPVLVKPGYSRGSRGQNVCNNFEEVKKALDVAKQTSFNNDYIVEKYMGACNDFTMTLFFVDGECYLVRTADRLLGDIKNGLEKVAMAELTPSRYQNFYISNVHNKIVRMLKGLGIKNGPVFMQGFVDNNTIRFYDPAFRNPGVEFNLMLKKTTGIDLEKALVNFAIKGKIDNPFIGKSEDDILTLNGHYAIELFPCVKKGTIAQINGLEEIKKMKNVVFVSMRHKIGDVVDFYGNANQRLCEIDIVASSLKELKETVLKVQSALIVLDDDGNNLIINPLDLEKI